MQICFLRLVGLSFDIQVKRLQKNLYCFLALLKKSLIFQILVVIRLPLQQNIIAYGTATTPFLVISRVVERS